jgi:hypothetical protein
MVAQIDALYAKLRPSKVPPRLISYALFEGRPLTTKGRWINPLVFAHLGLEARMPQTREVRKPVFIVGTGRSGTTILGVVMSLHRDVGFLNEPKAMWHVVHHQEDVVGNYATGAARYRLGEQDASDDVVSRARRLFGAYLRAVGATRVLDKYPELVFRVPFVRAIFPDARFVFLVRNGSDAIRSIEGWSRRLGKRAHGNVQDWWGSNNRKWRLMVEQLVPEEGLLANRSEEIAGLTRHADMAAVEWIVTMQEGLRQAEQNPDRFYMLRYEALVTDPAHQLADLLAFCDLQPDKAVLDFAINKLRPAPERAPLDVHPILRRPLEDTMRELGYRDG